MSDKKQIETTRIHQIISLLDLTNLNDDCDQKAIEVLCNQAKTPVGNVAAVCVWPEFVSEAQRCLGSDSVIKIATVVNFPKGDQSLQSVCIMIDKALADGAREIDYVLPYMKLIDGNKEYVLNAIQSVRKHIPESVKLKVILETGELSTEPLIKTAASIAIGEGADFIKTSTGKVPVNATLEAATVMLNVIAKSGADVGFKAAGGIKTADEAISYIQLAEARLGSDWVNPARFRFGASSLLQDALLQLDIGTPQSSTGDKY